MIRHFVWLSAAMLLLLTAAPTGAAPISWDDNGNDASKEWSVFNNWNPDGSPASDSITIGDLADAFGDRTLVDQDFTIDSLTVFNQADVDTSGNRLTVNGLTTVSGSLSVILVDPRSGGDQVGFDSQGITLNSGATLSLLGQVGSTAGGIVELESGIFNINAGALVAGHGTIQLIEAAPAVPGIVMQNSGRLLVSGRPGLLPSEALPGTLTITHAGAGTGTIDLDGTTGDGIVDVDDSVGLFNDTSLTLVIEPPLFENFSGQMDIGNGDTVNIVNPWEMNAGGTNPAILNFNSTGTHTLTGGTLTVGGATTQVNVNAGTAVFDANLTFNDGQFTLADDTFVRFDGATTFADATDITNGERTVILVSAVMNVGDATVAAGEDFDWDGPVNISATHVLADGDLNINVENLDNDGTDNFDGTIVMHSGNVDVQVADGAWILHGVGIIIRNSDNDVPVLSGDAIQIGNDDSVYTFLTVQGTGVSQVTAPITLMADAQLDIFEPSAILQTGAVTFQSDNGSNNAR